MIKLFTLFFVLISCSAIDMIEGKKFISPNNENIVVKGAFFVDKSDERLIINRFDNNFLSHKQTFANPVKANTQSGVSICFSTNSSNISLFFEERDDAQHRQKVFGIFKNGAFFKEIKGLEFTIENQDTDCFSDWRIVLPTFFGINFTGIKIDKNSELKKVEYEQKPVYVAIGNSITHGVGQKGASYLSYPFLLAERKNWELYNLAIGGSKISWPVARLLKNKKVDIITILWGYNDWNSAFTIENEIKPYYKKLISELRKVQPGAKIYCILPTTSKSTTPKNGSNSLEDIRNAESDVVRGFQQKGDTKLFIINGKELTTTADLNDNVHLSVNGTASFAKELEQKIDL
ncbi:MAG: SGNH/GDSL hydrolase family protein, partial [Draconibacterium sp.]|nr:SGNH/GDSL hydrolase family protein [Draconibacterium sp.]